MDGNELRLLIEGKKVAEERAAQAEATIQRMEVDLHKSTESLARLQGVVRLVEIGSTMGIPVEVLTTLEPNAFDLSDEGAVREKLRKFSAVGRQAGRQIGNHARPVSLN